MPENPSTPAPRRKAMSLEAHYVRILTARQREVVILEEVLRTIRANPAMAAPFDAHNDFLANDAV